MDGNKGGTVVTFETGLGLLDARALWASIVGPHRLAVSPRKIVNLTANPVELTKNLGVSDAYVLVGIAALPDPVEPGTNRSIYLGRDPNLGRGSWPVFLAAGGANVHYPVTVLLLPGEQLFAQEQNAEPISILVASVII